MDKQDNDRLYLMFNANRSAVDFALPAIAEQRYWYVAADTSQPPGHDLAGAGQEPLWGNPKAYPLAALSSAILIERRAPKAPERP